jgi:sugar lactone lactonase YvrE
VRYVLAFALCGCHSCGSAPPVVGDTDAADAQPIAILPDAPSAPRHVDACKNVLLLDDKGDVLAFSPDAPKIERISHASCDFGTDLGPRSMAVENDGTAWAGTWDGRIVRIHPSDGLCERMPFAPGQSGFSALNLTFAGDTLWAADDHGWGGDVTPSKGLAKIDRTTLALTPFAQPVGDRSLLLAGTRDGKLYAQPPVTIGLVELEKKKPSFKALGGFEDFAKGPGAPMAFYDGMIFVFQGVGGLFHDAETAGVLRFDPAKKRYAVILPVFEGTIVSAGAAPCAGSK